MSPFGSRKAVQKTKSPPTLANVASIEHLGLQSVHMGKKMATNDEYPLHDARLHHMVNNVQWQDKSQRVAKKSLTANYDLSRVLRIEGVLVPRASAAALEHQLDYVRLGLPIYVRSLFGWQATKDDPLYSNSEDVWWVRAWPTSALATSIADNGTVQRHDAAGILQRSGRGFTVTADLEFDIFYSMDANDRAWPQGLVVKVVCSVMTGLNDGRPEPCRRPGVDDRSDGCHLPTCPGFAPYTVKQQLADIGLLGSVKPPAKGTHDSREANMAATATTTANHRPGERRVEDERRPSNMEENHVMVMKNTASSYAAPQEVRWPTTRDLARAVRK